MHSNVLMDGIHMNCSHAGLGGGHAEQPSRQPQAHGGGPPEGPGKETKNIHAPVRCRTIGAEATQAAAWLMQPFHSSPGPPLLAEHAVQHDARLAGQRCVDQLVHRAVVCKVLCLHVDCTLDVAAREVLFWGLLSPGAADGQEKPQRQGEVACAGSCAWQLALITAAGGMRVALWDVA